MSDFITVDDLLIEADATLGLDGLPLPEGMPTNVVLLILDRDSVVFHDRGLCDYDHVEIRPNPHILAVVSPDSHHQWHNAARPLTSFPQKLRYKAMLCMKVLIGSLGIYPFQKIWVRTVPESWRSNDVSDKPGYDT